MDNMLNIIDDDEAEDAQKRRNAANNILVLAREEATANQLCAKGGVAKLKDMLEDDDREVKLAAVRALVSNRRCVVDIRTSELFVHLNYSYHLILLRLSTLSRFISFSLFPL